MATVLALGTGAGFVSDIRAASAVPIIWRVEDARQVGGLTPTVLGTPRTVIEAGRKGLRFDGKSDGLILPLNPLQDRRTFTVEVFFKPDADGPPAQRFVHLEDAAENRALIETRVTGDKHWYLDTFLYWHSTQKGVTLVDKTKLHPCDRWYWAALVYDGAVMSHHVNGTKEREDAMAFGPMEEGRTSIGVRLNQVYWFKGCIAEIRVHSRALTSAELQRP
jgi:hypothetical protein